jgi:alpha-L-fucosidase
MKHNQAQLRELITGYGKIDMIFFDGEPQGLADLAWDLQPDTVVTRGAIKTPEQHIPGTPIDEPWESCLTMGTQWQYKPTNESYMSGGDIIRKLVETRAKGGNMLLNVGPKPDGELPIEQEERLREVALWMFVNGECIYGVRPWIVTNEGDLWFTHNRKTGTLYVIACPQQRWPIGEWKDFTLHSVEATAQTKATVLGQNDQALEYEPDVIPKTSFEQTPDGLKLRAMRAQRLYNDRRWPNPVVIKLTHVETALVPPQVVTLKVERDPSNSTARLLGRLASIGDAREIEVSAEFRDITGLDIYERIENWESTPSIRLSSTDEFTIPVSGLKPNRTYELRAKARHPLLTVYGAEARLAP